MSSKISTLISFSYIPFGVYLKYGASYLAGLSVRKVRTHMGAATGHRGRAEGLPEVQKPILEYPTEKTRPEGNQEMTDNPASVEFDWVTARAECSVYRAFKELLEGVKKDVDKRNSLRRDSDPKWSVKAIDEKGFTVFREENTSFPSGATIDFVLSEHGIKVSDEKALKFTVAVTLNDEGRCIFKAKNLEREQWQVRRMALEDLFFGPKS